jgi:hypothetical protein
VPDRLCENFLYRFKAAPQGRSRRRLGGLAYAPADAFASAGLTPVGWRETTNSRPPWVTRSSRCAGGFAPGPALSASPGTCQERLRRPSDGLRRLLTEPGRESRSSHLSGAGGGPAKPGLTGCCTRCCTGRRSRPRKRLTALPAPQDRGPRGLLVLVCCAGGPTRRRAPGRRSGVGDGLHAAGDD